MLDSVVGYDEHGNIVAVFDGETKTVPNAPGNREYGLIKAWESQGNTIPMISLDLTKYEQAIQAHLDVTARSKSYSSGISLATYVNSTVASWAAEAAAFIAWRDAVWTYAYAELVKVQEGTRTAPSADAFLQELPTITWP